MQRKAYVPAVAALLAALLAGCTGVSASGGAADDSKGSTTGTTASAAQPGKYRTIPQACGSVGRDSLDSLLPGIRQIADEEQRDKAYQGEATLTYDTDRRDGCRWRVESTSASDHLFVDFERVVSYDNAVSDDGKASQIYTGKETAANLPEPAGSSTGSANPSTSASGSASSTATATPSAPSTSATSPTAPASPSKPPAALQPRTLDDLGDEAFLNDKLSAASSTTQRRTVTVVFRTSNVIVTIEYAEQPTASTDAPDSEEMQDRARKLAQKLADTLNS
ncbi:MULTISPECIES: hypothetical protein [Streptomyces]|uniref:DUF3558 domain-containing protein n=1 Tax=Streptomyces dengpaensis TaxID=2049881 RepID=A0ABN5I1F9_9ACTN|nr:MULTISPECIES: hypothetical protein [Streptomyces]AVH57243.1 hypothetical protein C4B68_17305 [Streptomyces dengpaensis]PIB03727.1 hypothetical protein B1C81_36115 [Streptomyces sp. HG99]